MPDATLIEAINLALARAMADDQRVILLGEDIGKDGGATKNASVITATARKPFCNNPHA